MYSRLTDAIKELTCSVRSIPDDVKVQIKFCVSKGFIAPRQDKHILNFLRDELKSVMRQIDKLHEAAERLEREYNCTVVVPFPSLRQSKIPYKDAFPEMDEETFAKRRSSLARISEPLKRQTMQAEYVATIGKIIDERYERIAKLVSRIKSGGNADIEKEVAKNRQKHIEAIVEAFKKRQYALIGDFARTRKLILRNCSANTEKVRTAMGEDDNLSQYLMGNMQDITPNLELLIQSEAAMRRGKRQIGTSMAFGGRGEYK